MINRDKRLVGIVSLGDIALADDPRQNAAAALCGVDGEHSPASSFLAFCMATAASLRAPA